MRFLKLPLHILLDFQVYVLVEVDAVLAHVVMLGAQPYDKSIAITYLPVPPSFIDMMQMESSIVADVKQFPAEVAFLLCLD